MGTSVNGVDHLAGIKWKQGQLETLPAIQDLAQHLAGQINFQSASGNNIELVKVSQLATIMQNLGWLYDQLLPILKANYQPTSVHQFWAGLPQLLRQKLINPSYPLLVTANYDNLLEKAFEKAGEPYDLLCYADESDHQH